MINQKKKNTLALWIVVVLIGCSRTLSGFDSVVASPTSGITITPPIFTATISPSFESPQFILTFDSTEAYVHSFMNPSTPAPTLDMESLNRLIELLHSDSCKLPCYLGITPGRTTWDEANSILTSLGAYFSYNTDTDGLVIHNTELNIGDESMIGVTPDRNTGVTDLKIIQSIHLLVRNGIVEKLWTSISTRKFIEKYDEYWSEYSLYMMLYQYGIPDQIVMTTPAPGATGTSFTLIYERKGIVTMIWDEIVNNQFCPGSVKTSSSLDLTLTNVDSGINIYQPGVVAPTFREIYKPIENLLGVDEQEFYTKLMSNPLTCFEVKKISP